MNSKASQLQRLRCLLVAPLFLVASCRADDSAVIGDSSGSSSPAAAITMETTPTSITSSTITFTFEQDDSRCPTDALAGDTIEPIIAFVCLDGWATGLLANQGCSDECEGILVLRQEATGWRVVATCHQYFPMTPTFSQCFNPFTYDEVNSSDLPPLPVACELWEANRWDENLALTGCEA